MEGFLGASDLKGSTCNAGDPGSIPGLATVHAVAKSQLITHTCTYVYINIDEHVYVYLPPCSFSSLKLKFHETTFTCPAHL